MLGVEFFFLLSGYFMAASIAKMKETDSAVSFLRKKISSFYPELVVCWILSCIVWTAAAHCSGSLSAGKLIFYPVSFFNDLLFMGMLGMGHSYSAIVVNWYLSSMLIGMVVLYPYLRRRGADIYLFCISLFILGTLSHGRSQCLGAPFHWVGFTYWGNIRALCELGMGASLYPFVKYLNTLSAGVHTRRIMTGVKALLFVALMVIVFQRQREFDGIWLVMAWGMLACMLSNQCYRLSVLDNKVVYFLGKLSLLLFLSHPICYKNLNVFVSKELSTEAKIGIYVCLSFVSALLCMYVARLFRRAIEKVKTQPN